MVCSMQSGPIRCNKTPTVARCESNLQWIQHTWNWKERLTCNLENLTKVIDRSTARNAATSKNIDHIKDYCRALYKWTPSSKGLGGCMELEWYQDTVVMVAILHTVQALMVFLWSKLPLIINQTLAGSDGEL